MAGPRCATHADRFARAACSRCGDFACEACFGEPECDLCPVCAPRDVREVERSAKSWMRRHPGRALLFGLGWAGTMGSAAILPLVLDRRPELFALPVVTLALGALALRAGPRDRAGPAAPLAIGGLLAGGVLVGLLHAFR